jgi:hypothetical protein
MFKHLLIYIDFQKTLEKYYQPTGERPATVGKEDEQIYGCQLPIDMGDKYKLYGLHYTRIEKRTHC